MQSTKAVRSLKKLFEGYHEPTLSKQQSQKLLDGLKTSFRGHLDREYGQSPGSAQPASTSNDTGKTSTPSMRRSAAHQHLKELLSNPMFTYNREALSEKSPAISPVAPPTRDPMEVFDHAVSRGMMTLGAATGILRAKRQELQNDSNARSPDVALRVVRWLRSSQNATSLAFLENLNFVKALMPFLIMENMETTVWEWLAKLVTRAEGDDYTDQRMRAASGLLKELVLFKGGSQERNSIDEAIASLLQADMTMPSSEARDRVLPQSWRSISWLATVDNFKTTTASEKLYDAHIATSSHFGRRVPVETAHLHLYHPTHPNHGPALSLFKDTKLVQNLVRKSTPMPSTWVSLPPWIVVLGHDTMNFLLRAGRNQEAEDLALLLKSGLSSLFQGPDSLSSYLREAPRFSPP